MIASTLFASSFNLGFENVDVLTLFNMMGKGRKDAETLFKVHVLMKYYRSSEEMVSD